MLLSLLKNDITFDNNGDAWNNGSPLRNQTTHPSVAIGFYPRHTGGLKQNMWLSIFEPIKAYSLVHFTNWKVSFLQESLWSFGLYIFRIVHNGIKSHWMRYKVYIWYTCIPFLNPFEEFGIKTVLQIVVVEIVPGLALNVKTIYTTFGSFAMLQELIKHNHCSAERMWRQQSLTDGQIDPYMVFFFAFHFDQNTTSTSNSNLITFITWHGIVWWQQSKSNVSSVSATSRH